MDTQRPHIRVKHEELHQMISPEKVRELSLDDLTEQYGTAGLHARLDEALDQADLSSNQLIQRTTELGLQLHANDVRTNGHYNDHLIRVTVRMLEDFGIRDPNIIAAGPMHDSLEDHPRDLVFSLTGNKIQDPEYARFIGKNALIIMSNEEVADIISDVTNPIVQPDEDKLESYNRHVKHLVDTSQKGRVLKLSDFIDNAVGNHATIGPLQRKLDLKYIDQYDVHKNGLYLEDSLITGSERDFAADQLRRGYERAMGRLAITR